MYGMSKPGEAMTSSGATTSRGDKIAIKLKILTLKSRGPNMHKKSSIGRSGHFNLPH
jgi:hypothetical protein